MSHRKKAAYRAEIGKHLGQLYTPFAETFPSHRCPELPSPADTVSRLENIQRFLELGEITRAQDLIGQLIDGYKQ